MAAIALRSTSIGDRFEMPYGTGIGAMAERLEFDPYIVERKVLPHKPLTARRPLTRPSPRRRACHSRGRAGVTR